MNYKFIKSISQNTVIKSSIQYFFFIQLCFVCASSYALDFYVSPSGNDESDGLSIDVQTSHSHAAFHSLHRAQRAIRELKKTGNFNEPVNVHIQAGTYFLNQPLEFDERDTGFVGKEITWQSEYGTSLISGGIPLTDCHLENKILWQCNVAHLELPVNKFKSDSRKKGDFPGFNLYVNQEQFHLARWPDSGWAHIKQTLDEKTSFTSFEQIPEFNNELAQAQVHIFAGNDYHDEYLPVLSSSASQNQIKLAVNTAAPLASGRRYYLQNIQSELNANQEWFYDKAHDLIQFITQQNGPAQSIIISYLPNLIKISNAQYLKFTNLNFQHSTNTAITIKDSNHLNFDRLEINNVDTTAIEAVNSEYITLSNSHLHHTGEGSIIMSGGDRKTLKASNNTVHNTHIHHFGTIILSSSPAILTQGVGSIMTHNLIENGAGLAVSINGNDHLFEKNEIQRVCEQVSDCGAVYSGRNWTWRGNKVQFNHIHDLFGYGLKKVDIAKNIVEYGSPDGARGVYLDDGLSSYSIVGNIFQNAGDMTIQLGGGRDNLIENNFIYTNSCALCVDDRWPDFNWESHRKSLKESPYLSIEWQKKYPELSKPMHNETWPEGNRILRNVIVSSKLDGLSFSYFLPENTNLISDNLVWGLNGKIEISYNILDRLNTRGFAPWDKWLSLGFEKNSIKADPCATIIGNRLNFCNDSPAYKIGFKNLPDDIGLLSHLN